MARMTWLENATSVVIAKRKVVTYRDQASRMASFGAIGTIVNRYRIHIKPATSSLETSALSSAIRESELRTNSRRSRKCATS